MQEKVYKNYTSTEKLELTCKDHFTEKAGFPNEFAFLDFAQQIKREDEMYLVCLNVDLRKANRISYAFGSYTLRKFMVSLEGFYVFRIQGEKLNIFVPESGVQELKSILDAPNEFIDVYYGFVPEYFDAADLDQQRSVGVELMYQDKAKKHSKAKSGDSLLAGKGNTPVGLQETFERKYKETMWYSVAKIAVTSPVFKEVTVHIFPTEFRSPMESVIHCFSYSVEMARIYLKKGFYLGIGGVVTFKNGRKLVEVVKEAPLEQLVLETDSPYLTPVPNRGKRNDSRQLTHVVDAIAQIKGISREEVIRVTEQNARRMYRIRG